MGSSPRRPVLALEVTALDSVFSLMWMLLCVVAIVVLAYLFTKYVAGRRGLGGFGAPGGTGRFKALAPSLASAGKISSRSPSYAWSS